MFEVVTVAAPTVPTGLYFVPFHFVFNYHGRFICCMAGCLVATTTTGTGSGTGSTTTMILPPYLLVTFLQSYNYNNYYNY